MTDVADVGLSTYVADRTARRLLPRWTWNTLPVMRRLAILLVPFAAWSQSLLVGTARRDNTPREPVSMWGYGAHHAFLSDGIIDSLYA